MKKYIFSILVLLLVCISPTTLAIDELVLNVSSDYFHFYDDAKGEMTSRVTSFFIPENQREIYILDTLNKEIMVFKDNKPVRNINLPQERSEYISLFVLKNNTIAVLLEQRDMFANPEIIVINRKGQIVKKLTLPLNEKNVHLANLPNGPQKFYNPVFALEYMDDEKTVIQYANGKVFILHDNEFTEYSSSEFVSGPNKISMFSRKYAENLNQDIEYVTYFEEAGDEDHYYAARVVRKTYKHNVSSKYLKLRYDENDNHKDDIKLSPNGVYQLLCTGETVSIIHHSFGADYRLDKINKPANEISNKEPKTAKAAPGRDEVYLTAYNFASHKWTYDSKLNWLHIKLTKIPDYLLSLTHEAVKGVPYCWGGAQTVGEFDQTLSSYQAGNAATGGDYKKDTAGVDCSGFISICYQTRDRLSTRTMINEFTPINRADSGFMDIFNRPGDHVLIKVSEDQDGVYSLEASISGDDKVSFRYRSNYYLHNFTAMRYDPWLDLTSD